MNNYCQKEMSAKGINRKQMRISTEKINTGPRKQ